MSSMACVKRRKIWDMATFSERVKEIRTEKGMRQQDPADKVGVSKVTVSLWERESIRPDFYAVKSFAAYLIPQ